MKNIVLNLIFVFAILSFSANLFSFETVNVSNSGSHSMDAYVAFDVAGNICVVWVEEISGANHKIYYSIRESGNWSSPAPITGAQSAMNADPHVSRGRGDNAFVCVWHDLSNQKIKFASYVSGNWGSPISLGHTGGYHLGIPKVGAQENKISIIWERGNPIKPEIYSQTWLNNRWGSIVNTSTTSNWTSKDGDMYLGVNNKTYDVWREKQNIGSVKYYVMMNHDEGNADWGTSAFVTDGSFIPYKPVVATNINGDICVGFYDGGCYRSVIYSSDGGKQYTDCIDYWGIHTDHDWYYSDVAGMGSGFIFVCRGIQLNIGYSVWDGTSWSPFERITTGSDTYHPGVDFHAAFGAAIVWTNETKNDVMCAVIEFGGDGEEPPPVNEPPTAKFTYEPTEGLYPLAVNFNASNSSDPDGIIVKYDWNFGDGEDGSGETIAHVFQNKGSYRVTLVVTDDFGATDDASANVTVVGIEPPINVKYEVLENKTLFTTEYLYKVTWDKNPKNVELGSNVITYRIYRRALNDEGYTHYATVPAASENKFWDRSLGESNIVYLYGVVGVDTEGRESDMGIN